MRQRAGSGIVQRFLAFARANDLSGQTVGIAFSGGPDSTALAIAASEAAQAGLFTPVAIHVDHGVRIDSAADLPVVQDACSRLGIALRSVRTHLGPDASEDEMRVQRYLLLADEIEAAGGHAIMTAHHSNDQAETVLLHMIRGSGLEGVAGMAPSDTHVEFGTGAGLTVQRPFLLETRAALLELVEERGLPYVIDPTNLERHKARNAIRHDVLPVLESIRPGAGAAIARLAEIAREDNDALQEESSRAESASVVDGQLDVRALGDEPVAVQRRVIRSWVHKRTGVELTWNRTEALRAAVLAGQGGTMIELGEHWVARRGGNRVFLSRTAEGSEG